MLFMHKGPWRGWAAWMLVLSLVGAGLWESGRWLPPASAAAAPAAVELAMRGLRWAVLAYTGALWAASLLAAAGVVAGRFGWRRGARLAAAALVCLPRQARLGVPAVAVAAATAACSTVGSARLLSPAAPPPGLSAGVAPPPAQPSPAPAPGPRLSPPGSPGTPAPLTVVVGVGDSLWSIAQRVVQAAGPGPAGPAGVARYWLRLEAANSSRLVRPGDYDLVYPGKILELPGPG